MNARFNFNDSWAYFCGDTSGAEEPGFDDRDWVPVTIPHTLALEPKHDGCYNFKGIGWYRRYFTLDPKYFGQRINIEFQGVMIDSDVYLNGEKLATRSGGYIGFSVDISGKIRFGGDNVLAVRVSNRDNPDTPPGKPEVKLDFHYYGGIYRNVFLRIQDPLRITDALQVGEVAGGGVFVTYPKVANDQALVHVKTHVANDRSSGASFTLSTLLVDSQGNTVAEANTSSALESGRSQHIEQDIAVIQPRLWHPDHPNIYTLVSNVMESGKVVDTQETRIGLRRIEFRPDGFYINGKKLYLRGGNRHQQFQNVGCAAPDSMQRRDALLMREGGFNAVRAGHYPNSTSFLDACDEVGLLVIECQPGWQWFNKTRAFWDHTVRDCREMIRRDRNHPSVVLWEASLNETPSPEDWKLAVTAAAHEEYPGDQLYLADDGVSPYYNVGYKVLCLRDSFEDRDPHKPFITREWGDWEENSKSTRDQLGMLRQVVYHQVYLNGDGYDDWGGLERCDRIAGVFKWSWMDHTRGMYGITAGCGSVDINRYAKFLHYWLKSMMDARNPNHGAMVYVADFNIPDSRWADTIFSSKYHNRKGEWTVSWSSTHVMVFSNCDSVRLYQDGILVDEQSRKDNAATAPFIARKGGSPYFVFKLKTRQLGTLKAEGLLDGKPVVTHEVRTPEKPEQILVETCSIGVPFVADGSDLMPVYFKIADKNGTLVSTASHEIHISVQGEGKLVGAGLPRIGVEHQKAEFGLGFAYVRSTGKPGRILVRAESCGLRSGEAILFSTAATCQFVPDGTHAAWTGDERISEPIIERVKAAYRDSDGLIRLTPLPREAIESIMASCPSADGRGPDTLMDGITEFGTGWLADTGILPQSVTVKFNEPRALNGIRIHWEKDSTWYTYDLETSEDGKVWEKMGGARSATGHENSPIAFKTAATLFFRITITDVKTGTGANVIGMSEVRFY